MQEEKQQILNLDVERECRNMKDLLEFVNKIVHSLDLSEFYDEIKTYYPIIRMFFLFFDPSQIVKIVREALIKTKEFAEKIDAEVVYVFLKKVIEVLRNFIDDYYADLLLKYAKDFYNFIKGFSGKIDVDAICNLVTDALNALKNYIISYDADYIVNEIKEGWDVVVKEADFWSPDYAIPLFKNYLLNLIDAGKKFDVELIVNLFQEVINVLKAFFKEMNKKKFLNF